MTTTYNNEKVLYTFKAKRKLKPTSHAANMMANCLLSRGQENSAVEYDIYTIYLTDKTFFAEYSRSMFHGGTPKKVVKLNIPIEDLVRVVLDKNKERTALLVDSAWGKNYVFELNTEKDIEIAGNIAEYIKNLKK